MHTRSKNSIQVTVIRRWYAALLLIFALGAMGLMPMAKAQDGGSDPVTGVEVTIDPPSGGSSGSAHANAVSVTVRTLWRDAVSTASATIHCYDKDGHSVSNAPVDTISIDYHGIVSPTSGTTDSNGNLRVSIRSSDLSADDSPATLTATSEKVNGTASLTFKGALQIMNGNTDVTEGTINSNVGEKQNLTAKLRSGVPLTTTTWSISAGTPIKGWSSSDPNKPLASKTTYLADADYTQSSAPFSMPFFVTTTGNAYITLGATDAGGSGFTLTCIVISAPSCSFTAAEKIPVARHLEVALGSYDASVPGIQFTGSGGSGGTLSSAQILTQDTVSITDDSGTNEEPSANIPGLDNTFPYSSDGSPADSPDIKISADAHPTELDRSFKATMYLLWTSNRSGAIPIPVDSIDWKWSAGVPFNPQTGNPPASFPHSPAVSLTGTPVTTGVLNWTQTSKNKT